MYIDVENLDGKASRRVCWRALLGSTARHDDSAGDDVSTGQMEAFVLEAGRRQKIKNKDMQSTSLEVFSLQKWARKTHGIVFNDMLKTASDGVHR